MTTLASPHVVHALPGRLRVHAPECAQAAPGRLEQRLGSLPGVQRVRASAATGNVLVCFDSARLERERLLAALADLEAAPPPAGEEPAEPAEETSYPAAVVRPDAGPHGRARITVSGLDRDPQLARRVQERLEARPEVKRAEASPITGRVLVEFSRRVGDLDDVLNEVAKLQLPPRPGEDRPEHPLDPGPLVQSAARVIGSGLGLAVLAVRQARRSDTALIRSHVPATVAGAIGIAEGLPPSDLLPAVSVAVQPPEHRKLSGLAREGTAALDRPLRVEILRRGAATAVPALGAYVLANRSSAQPQTVAFASIVSTQLAQTLDLGRLDGRISGSVAWAVVGTAGLLALAVTLPSLQAFFGLAAPSLPAIALVGGAAAGAVALGSALAR